MSGSGLPQVFAGLKVLDVATVIAAPAAAMILADFGADVIKVEAPGAGDMLRLLSTIPTVPPDAADDFLWHMDGRNKRGLTLNLKTPEGMAVLRKLAAGCDVFVTNQPLPVRTSLGLRYEDLRPLNPRMIYASLSAYGETGPERDGKGFDQVAYWARSGLMDLMRAPGTPPTQGLPGMGDHPTALALYAGIVTALLQRERTGEGGEVQTSLLANGLWSAACIVQGALAGGDMARYHQINHAPSPMMQPYRTHDDRWLLFNMVRTEPLRDALFEGLGASELLADARFNTLEGMRANGAELRARLQDIIGQKTSAEWLRLFDDLDVPVTRIARVEEALVDAQVLLNGMAVPGADTVGLPLLLRHPIRVSSAPLSNATTAPGLGEHNDEILHELGYGDAEIDALKAKGVF